MGIGAALAGLGSGVSTATRAGLAAVVAGAAGVGATGEDFDRAACRPGLTGAPGTAGLVALMGAGLVAGALGATGLVAVFFNVFVVLAIGSY